MNRDKMKMVKCVVWDLDNTLWDGILPEDKNVKFRENVGKIILALDQRGILQSVASKNDHNDAMQMLEQFGIAEYFLFPQINWSSKSHSITTIAQRLNIHPEAMAFVDDSPFELDEVRFGLPGVCCIPAGQIPVMLEMPELNPGVVTNDGRQRRKMYLSDLRRQAAEGEFHGPKEEFLKSLRMKLTIFTPGKSDLLRAAELTQRTNQLNTTGYSYSAEELEILRRSPNHLLLMAGLKDKYGDYGKIGLALIEQKEDIWTIKLLLMSCRVMSQGVGSVMLSCIINMAREQRKQLRAEYIPNDRNRMMQITYKFMNFRATGSENGKVIFGHESGEAHQYPDYMDVKEKIRLNF